MGGWKKEGGGKPHEGHPSQKGVLDPLRLVRFPPPQVSLLFFLYNNPRGSRPETLLEGSKTFSGGRAVWYVFLGEVFLPTVVLFCLQLSFFAYSPLK